MSGSEARTDTEICENPFDHGGELCSICRSLPESVNGRRCSRMIVRSPTMQELMRRVARIARSDATLVLQGESGAGKEVVARAVHANGTRRDKPFVALNCAALPQDLLESEMFGHARGAFTGASQARKGYFETANGGTLFLDEIADMPLHLQAKLLRALQDGEIVRVGETRALNVDVRVICATHYNLRERVRAGQFREDLYFRLNVFTVVVPPLRERREDILPLAGFLLRKAGHSGRITPAAYDAIMSHDWPGNVRELSNAMKHAAVMADEADIAPEHLPDNGLRAHGPREHQVAADARAVALSDLPDSVGAGVASAPGWQIASSREVVAAASDVAKPTGARPCDELPSLAEVERQHILRVLEACGGAQVEASKILGVSRTTLWRKLREYGIN